MKITVDIPNKTIQIHGSFKYEEYQSMHKDLPLEWKGFTFEIVPVYVETRPWTYNSTLEALNSCVGCKCNDVAEKLAEPPNQPSLFD